MTGNDIREFMTALEGAKDLSPLDKIAMKQKFFDQRVKVDPDWSAAPPQARFEFAKKFGISPGLAQMGEGEFVQAGLLPKPKGDLGEVRDPNVFLDPITGLSGGAAALLGKAPFFGAALAARNPLIRDAAKQGVLKAMADWQTMGLGRAPGAIGRGAANILSRFRGAPAAPPAAGPVQMPLPIAGGATKPRVRYGPGGIEMLP